MPKRRMGSIPARVCFTQTTVDRVEAYQAAQQIVSFSAATEALVLLGLEQSPVEVMTPIIESAVRREFAKGIGRIARLLVYNIVETGVAQRMAGAAVYHLYDQADRRRGPEKYDMVKQEIRDDAYRTFSRATISRTLDDLRAVGDDPLI